MLTIILLLIATILFGLDAFGINSGRFGLVAAGLFFLALSMLLPLLGPLL